MYFLEVFPASMAPCGIVAARHAGGGHGRRGADGFGLDLQPLSVKYTGASILCASLSRASAKWRAARLSVAYSKGVRVGVRCPGSPCGRGARRHPARPRRGYPELIHP